MEENPDDMDQPVQTAHDAVDQMEVTTIVEMHEPGCLPLPPSRQADNLLVNELDRLTIDSSLSSTCVATPSRQGTPAQPGHAESLAPPVDSIMDDAQTLPAATGTGSRWQRRKQRRFQRQRAEVSRLRQQGSSISRDATAIARPAGPASMVFLGNVNMSSFHADLELATLVCGMSSTPGHLTLWAAGSTSRGAAGYAVARQFQGEEWYYKIGRADGPVSPIHVDLLAIRMAMREAVHYIWQHRNSSPIPTTIRIFSHSQAALRWISQLPFVGLHGRILGVKGTIDALEEIAVASRSLRNVDATLEMHWVPVGMVEGNLVATAAASYAKYSPDKSREEEWESSLLLRRRRSLPADTMEGQSSDYVEVAAGESGSDGVVSQDKSGSTRESAKAWWTAKWMRLGTRFDKGTK